MRRTINIILVFILLVLAGRSFADKTRGVSTFAEDLGSNLKIGKQYLVVIGINEYQYWLPLHSPVKDIREIRDILVSRYYIDKVFELYDHEATKANIIKLFVKLQEKVQIHDSVLIVYSGHGHLDENSNTGFWIPVNAGTDIYEQHNWLPHTQLKGLISNIKASHVCVISDSCFAGDLIYNTRSIPANIDAEYFKRSYSRVSRQVLTSGATEAVPDESEFAKQLKSILRRNQDRYLDALMLYNEVRLGVESSIPLLGALGGTGHQEGASFLLFLREEAQEEPTPFGPIHLQPGPSPAAVEEEAGRYLTTALVAGCIFPVAHMNPAMNLGTNLRTQLHLNQTADSGTVGFGLSTGYTNIHNNGEAAESYNIDAIPLALNMRYTSVPRTRLFWYADLSCGAMLNFIRLDEITTKEQLMAAKPLLSPTLGLGRRFFDRWTLSAYGSYLLILFDNNPFTGIVAGARLEYAF